MTARNGLAVEVAELGQLYTSSDFLTWIPQDTHTSNALQAVVFFRDRLLASGENGTVVYSDDGANYVCTNLNTTDWLVGVAASPNLAVAVGDNAAIYTSTDGAFWKRQAAPPSVSGYWLLGVAFGAGAFVTVGEHGYIATSTNGTNWTYRSPPAATPPFTNAINRVVWVNSARGSNYLTMSGFWAVADNGRAIYSTNNGATWYLVANLVTATNIFYGAAGNDTTRVLAGDQDVRLSQTVGGTVTWPRQSYPSVVPSPAPAWTYYAAFWDTNGGSYWLAGDSGMLVQGYPTNDTYGWQMPFFSFRDWLWDVTVASGLYIAVGDNARVMTSDNGLDWTAELVPNTNSVSYTNTVFFGVGGNTNLLLAVGNQGSLALSPNQLYPVVTTNQDGSLSTNLISTMGEIWYSMPAPTTNDLHGIGVLSNKFYVVGGNGTMLTGTNGTNWRGLTLSTTAYLSSVETCSNGLVVVGDQGMILTSSNGTTWIQRTSNTTNWLYRVRNFGGKLVAVGENGTIRVSTNGINWTSAASGTTAWLNDIEMVTNNFYIVGTLGTVLTSTNLTNWANIGANTLKSLYGAASQNGQLLVVGIDGTIIRSQVIPELDPVNFLNYYRFGTVNLFQVGGDPDQRFRLNSSTNLIQWTTNGPLLEIMDSSGTLLFLQDTGTNGPGGTFYRTTLVY